MDIFFSAALKQMEALQEEGYIAEDASVDLLENKIVLIVPAGNESGYTSFEDIVNADMIAIGDPDSTAKRHWRIWISGAVWKEN